MLSFCLRRIGEIDSTWTPQREANANCGQEHQKRPEGKSQETWVSEAGGRRLISPTLLPGLLRPGSVTHLNSHFFPRVILGGPWSVTSLVMDFEEAGQLGL